MPKNNYAAQIIRAQDKYFNAGLDTGKQFAADMFEIAMHDCGINPAKIAEVAQHASDITSDYEGAIDVKRDKEADVKQHHIDEKLRRIYKDVFVPWEVRYDWLKTIRY